MRRYLLFALVAASLAFFVCIAGLSSAQPSRPNTDPRNAASRPGDVSFLTGPNDGQPLDIVLAHLQRQRTRYGLQPADLTDLIVTDLYRDRTTGITHIYLGQRYAGIALYNGLVSAHVAADGSIIGLTSRFISDLSGKVNAITAAVGPQQAAGVAISALGLIPDRPISLLEATAGRDSRALLSDGGFSAGPIPAHLVYYPIDTGPRLAWELQIETPDGQHYWQVFVDAADARVLDQHDLVTHDDFGPPGRSMAAHDRLPTDLSAAKPPNSYEVFAMPSEYPDDGPRVIAGNPAHPIASPHGWHDTDGAPGAEFTVTQGNNVSAYQDQDADGTPEPGEQPDGGPDLDFTGALVPLDLGQDPLSYSNASITNLFYWSNIVHDVFYVHGFDEPAGNFQINNYGRGGLGNDDLQAEGQDGSGTNGGNFFTPPDGARPKMQMFIWTLTTPRRDGDLESSIIIHEYGHGVSNRLTGGPSNVSCLFNAEQMGEGWSDWLALVLTAKESDGAETLRGIGTYVLGQPVTGQGFRPAQYTTDMTVNDYTYGDIALLPVPHGPGFVWATMLWDMYWELVEAHGFNSDFYGDWSTGGNNLAIRLVLDGLKFQPCGPGFVDGRDAILAADLALTGGVNQCALWRAFAGRGLGFSADQGSPNSTTDGTEAFDLPPACSFLEAAPLSQSVCLGQNALFTVGVGAGYSPPVTLSASGHPTPTSASFDPNPVTAVPGSAELTINNTAAAVPGIYPIAITGDDGAISSTVDVDLTLLAPPDAPALLSPPDGATGLAVPIVLNWDSPTSAENFTVEVASDPAFGTIVYSTTVSDTTAAVGGLAPLTTYFWRVRATNDCGVGALSAVFSFSTMGDADVALFLPVVTLSESGAAR